MSLRPLRVERKINTDFICLQTQELGGMLSVAASGGLYFAEYAINPNGARVLGIQLNDIEYIDLSRQYNPQRLRNTDFPNGIVGIGQGSYETDWLYFPISIPTPGQTAYLGPSGTITNEASLGGQQVGYFNSVFVDEPHTVIFRGQGFSFAVMDTFTKEVIITNNPEDIVSIPTPGYIGVHIHV